MGGLPGIAGFLAPIGDPASCSVSAWAGGERRGGELQEVPVIVPSTRSERVNCALYSEKLISARTD